MSIDERLDRLTERHEALLSELRARLISLPGRETAADQNLRTITQVRDFIRLIAERPRPACD
ncbi:MAG: hypothetical protein NTZ56_03535 [Acidobacteria bacterium]|nr:hypothetical protein [Acidobacteriota bacterium]